MFEVKYTDGKTCTGVPLDRNEATGNAAKVSEVGQL